MIDVKEHLLSEKIWASSQSLHLQRLYALPGGTRLRVTVKLDRYKMQSYAKAERWTGEAWQEVAYIPGEAMPSDPRLQSADILYRMSGDKGQQAERLIKDQALEVWAEMLLVLGS